MQPETQVHEGKYSFSKTSSGNSEIGIIWEPRESRNQMSSFLGAITLSSVVYNKKCYKPDVFVYACNSNTQEAEAGGSSI